MKTKNNGISKIHQKSDFWSKGRLNVSFVGDLKLIKVVENNKKKNKRKQIHIYVKSIDPLFTFKKITRRAHKMEFDKGRLTY